ncbi:MAG: MaoC family dehydratase [Myxococcota bacterium]
MTTDSIWPRTLERVTGPHPDAKIEGVAASMGDHGPTIGKLLAAGTLPPELMTGLTLFLLSGQPRRPRPLGAPNRKGAPGVSGRIWAREQQTIVRPLRIGEAFVVEGSSSGQHVRNGRRYGTTESATVDAEGRPAATNATTGLLSYRPAPDLVDGFEGLDPATRALPRPDFEAAARNPHLDALATAEVGEELGGTPVTVTLAMMAARDTSDPNNPIHSDPEAAKAAGLAKPIAGGDHVLAFALEKVMARFGAEVLLHGTCLDTRWKAPTECDVAIVPRARVTEVRADRVAIDYEVVLESGPTAMKGALVIPRPS